MIKCYNIWSIFGMMLLFCSNSLAQAQNPDLFEIDELIQYATSMAPDEEAFSYANLALQRSEQENYDLGLIQSYQLLASIEIQRRSFSSALRYYLQLLPVLERNDEQAIIFNTYYEIGQIHYNEKLYKEALAYYVEALQRVAGEQQRLDVLEQMADCHTYNKAPDSAIAILSELYTRYEQEANVIKCASTLEKIANNHINKGDYHSALFYNKKMLKHLVPRNVPKEMAIAYNNLAYNYIKLDSYDRAIANFEIALRVNDDSNQVEEATMLTNMGICYENMGNSKMALTQLKEAVKILPDSAVDKLSYVNELISAVYLKNKDYYNALLYNTSAIDQAQKANSAILLSDIYRQAGEIHENMYDFEKALQFFSAHLEIRDSLRTEEKLRQEKLLQQQILLERANKEIQLYQINEELSLAKLREQEANNEQLRLIAKEKDDSLALLQSEDSLKSARLREEQYRNFQASQQLKLERQRRLAEEKNRALLELEQEQRIQAAELSRVQSEKVANDLKLAAVTKEAELTRELNKQQRRSTQFAYGIGIALFIITLLVFIGLVVSQRSNKQLAQKNKEIEQQKAIVEQERQKSEELLLNILPEPTALELKEKGYATPKKYDLATVLFTDFSGFTSISELLSPEDLIKELNYCFVAFDEIIDQCGLEKIKTIGDGYMCVGGVPLPNHSNPIDAVKAALQMKQFMDEISTQKAAQGLPYWKMRVGIHSGELVAGVVGKRKFVYDIWGDTVNVASRMETNGIEGEINISSTTYELVKNEFHCSYRGAVDVKNKGKIDMYFVEG